MEVPRSSGSLSLRSFLLPIFLGFGLVAGSDEDDTTEDAGCEDEDWFPLIAMLHGPVKN